MLIYYWCIYRMGVDEYPLVDLIIFITQAVLIWKLEKEQSACRKLALAM